MCRKPDGEGAIRQRISDMVTPSEKWDEGKEYHAAGGEAFGMFLSGPSLRGAPRRYPVIPAQAGIQAQSIHAANLTSLHWALSYLQKNACSGKWTQPGSRLRGMTGPCFMSIRHDSWVLES